MLYYIRLLVKPKFNILADFVTFSSGFVRGRQASQKRHISPARLRKAAILAQLADPFIHDLTPFRTITIYLPRLVLLTFTANCGKIEQVYIVSALLTGV